MGFFSTIPSKSRKMFIHQKKHRAYQLKKDLFAFSVCESCSQVPKSFDLGVDNVWVVLSCSYSWQNINDQIFFFKRWYTRLMAGHKRQEDTFHMHQCSTFSWLLRCVFSLWFFCWLYTTSKDQADRTPPKDGVPFFGGGYLFKVPKRFMV